MGYGAGPGRLSFPKLILVAGVVAAVACALLALRSEPAAAAEGPVGATIRTDSHGIPHILADDYKGLGFGYGYAFAGDNICTIAESYVTVRAERSRYFGPDNGYAQRGNGFSANNLNSDFFYQRIIDEGVIEDLLAEPEPTGPRPEIVEGVSGYVAGYNKYLADTGVDNLPDPRCRGEEWVKPIEEIDAYRRFYQLALLASGTVAIDGIAGEKTPGTGGAPIPGDIADGLTEQLPIDGIGSNAYGLGSEATDNGKGIVLGNPHFPWDGPERFYQAHLTIPGEINVSGASLFGVPLILIGHTDNMAWSHTVSTAYRFTPFQETLNPVNPTQYLYDGSFRDMTEHEVTVDIDPSTPADDRTRTLYSTHHGFVLDDLVGVPLPWGPTTAFSMGDVNATNFRYLNHFFEVNRAQSVRRLDEIEAQFQGIPWVNTIAADSSGEAYYADIGAIPNVSDVKATTCNSAVGAATYAALRLPVLNGHLSACEWDDDPDAVAPGIFGYDNLPKLFRDDYVTNSNDSFWLSNPEEPLTGYAPIIGDEETQRTLRTRIGLKMLIERFGDGPDQPATDRLDRQDVQDIVFNNRQYAGELWRDELVAFCNSAPDGKLLGTDGEVDVSGACPVLAAWDLKDDLDSPGAILFREFAALALAGVSVIGDPSAFATPFDANDPVNTPNGLNEANPKVERSFADAVANLNAAGIPLDGSLRDYQYEKRGGDRIPIHGGPGGVGVFNAINVNSLVRQSGEVGYPNVPHGSSFVMVTQFTDDGCGMDDASILTYSQSENPDSLFHRDQTDLFSNKEWVSPASCEAELAVEPGLETTPIAGCLSDGCGPDDGGGGDGGGDDGGGAGTGAGGAGAGAVQGGQAAAPARCSPTKRGTHARDLLRGGPFDDRILGLRGPDRMFGGDGDDCLWGNRGNDRIAGNHGDDRISGSAGRDVLIGGPGRDHIKGGLKRDKVLVRDGQRDVVNCGPGRDIVYADFQDKLHACEVVKRKGRKGRKGRR